MANLKQGMSGSEVKELQNALIAKGYDVGKTGADGVFGKNTLAAVKQYQTDNGLQVDGIAGKNTLGSLYGADTTNQSNNQDNNKAAQTDAPVTSPGGVTYGDFTYESYAPSYVVQQANALVDQNNANKPGAWVDPYLSQHMDYLSQYENREPYSYDVNSDALYQQYKDNYILQGQMAMMDAMGQAAAMTGGYGNSYAQSVGQQAYNQYLNQLNEIIPELNQMSYDRYQNEGQELLNKYNLYKGLSDQSYDRYQDELDNWYKEDSRYEIAKANAKSDLISLITATGYKPSKEELDAAGMTEKQAEGYLKAYTGGSTGGNTSGTVAKETTASTEEKNNAIRRLAKCESADQLAGVVTALIYEGYSEDWVKVYAKMYDKWATTPGGTNTDVYLITNPWKAIQSESRGGGGGYKSTEIGRLTY